MGDLFLRPKSGLPKRKALKNMPEFACGHKEHPAVKQLRAQDSALYLRRYSVVSMFTGCGGLDLGTEGGFSFLGSYYEQLPFDVIAAYENDEKACETYSLNLDGCIHCTDLTKTDEATMPSGEILTGGFPCQDFSSCGPKTGLTGERGRLYKVMSRYMRKHRPKVVIGENVPFFLTLHDGKIAEEVLADFRACGYTFKVWQIYCPDYGLPQSRTRVFLIGYRNDLKITREPVCPEPSHLFRTVTIDDAIDDLKTITDESVPNQSQYFVATKATAGAGQGDQKSEKGKLGYAVRANPKARVHFHYDIDRRLTVRETARLQSFPDEFVFPHSASKNFMEIGNAVPPIIGHTIMKQVYKFLHYNGI